jgi:hypothetical protein
MIEGPTPTMTATPLPGSSRRRAPSRPFGREEDLYAPVKRFLEGLGYEAKGEVRGCDVLAVRPGGGADPPVVVELRGRLRSLPRWGERRYRRTISAVQEGTALPGGTPCGQWRAGRWSAISALGKP